MCGRTPNSAIPVAAVLRRSWRCQEGRGLALRSAVLRLVRIALSSLALQLLHPLKPASPIPKMCSRPLRLGWRSRIANAWRLSGTSCWRRFLVRSDGRMIKPRSGSTSDQRYIAYARVSLTDAPLLFGLLRSKPRLGLQHETGCGRAYRHSSTGQSGRDCLTQTLLPEPQGQMSVARASGYLRKRNLRGFGLSYQLKAMDNLPT
jgi:hypothetical protein